GAPRGSSFPSSAWERTAAKLCFASGPAPRDAVSGSGGVRRSRASGPRVPKQSLGTRGGGLRAEELKGTRTQLAPKDATRRVVAAAIGLGQLAQHLRTAVQRVDVNRVQDRVSPIEASHLTDLKRC